jgi:hypothetical protein
VGGGRWTVDGNGTSDSAVGGGRLRVVKVEQHTCPAEFSHRVFCFTQYRS